MLVLGDVHGNYTKVKMFLEYKPEEQHLFVGDYFDSFVSTVLQQLETFNLIVNSGAIMLAGNHDIQYFKRADQRVRCSGFSGNDNIFREVKEHIDKFVAAYYDEKQDIVITHGGVHPMLFGKNKLTGKEVVDKINEHFEVYKIRGVDGVIYKFKCKATIFNIGSIRGGWSQFGGPFWLDYRYEKLDTNFNQIVGHTKSKDSIKKIINGHKWYATTDTVKFECFNTDTLEVEDFMSEELKETRNLLEVCY